MMLDRRRPELSCAVIPGNLLSQCFFLWIEPSYVPLQARKFSISTETFSRHCIFQQNTEEDKRNDSGVYECAIVKSRTDFIEMSLVTEEDKLFE